jgi:hypothetical protein
VLHARTDGSRTLVPINRNSHTLFYRGTKMFALDGLVQLHWQNPAKPETTELVAQGGPFLSVGAINQWLVETYDRQAAHRPLGWVPMICDSTSEHFVLQ